MAVSPDTTRMPSKELASELMDTAKKLVDLAMKLEYGIEVKVTYTEKKGDQ